MRIRPPSFPRFADLCLCVQAEQNELKTDAKIDLLHRSGLTFASSSPAKKTQAATPARTKKMHEDMKEEQDVELDLVRTRFCRLRGLDSPARSFRWIAKTKGLTAHQARRMVERAMSSLAKR
jgi:hypothetical protein